MGGESNRGADAKTLKTSEKVGVGAGHRSGCRLAIYVTARWSLLRA